MRLTKRFLAGIVAILVLVSCTGCIVQKSESLTGTSRKSTSELVKKLEFNTSEFANSRESAYKNIVQQTVDKHGVLEDNAFNKSEGTTDITGLWEAKTFDVNGDKEDELFLVYLKNGKIYTQVYEYKNGAATETWNVPFEYCGFFELVMYKNDNGAHWLCYARKNDIYYVTAYVDGKYKTLYPAEEYTKEEFDNFNSGDPYAISPAESMYRDLKSRLGVESFDEYDGPNMLLALHAEGTNINVNEDELKSRWGIVIPEPKYSAADALAEIKYYGDKSKCQMTKEMALAYAEAIDSQKSIVEGNSGTQFDLYAALLDLSGDGMPILVTVVAERVSKDLFYMDGYPAVFVWTWDGKKAEKYDFGKDLALDDISDIWFSTYPGGGKVYVSEGASLADASSYGMLYYDVTNAQLLLERHETLYIATVSIEDNDYAHGKYLPGVNSKVYDGDIRFAKVSDLTDAGWIAGEYNEQVGRTPLYMLEVNGEFKPFGSNASFEQWYLEGYDTSGQLVLLTEINTGGSWLRDDTMEDAYTATDALRKYAGAVGKPTYSYDDVYTSLDDSVVEEIAKKVANEYGGEVGEIYKLADDLYYVIIYIDGEVSGTVIIKNTGNGKDWRIVKKSDDFITEDDLSKEVRKDERTPNITIDFGRIDDGAEYIEDLLKNIDGTCLNASAREELIKFVVASITRCSAGAVSADNNIVIVGGSDVHIIANEAVAKYNEYVELLNKYNIVLDRPITIIIQFVVRNANCKEPVQIKLTKDILDNFGSADELVFVLDGSSCSVKVSKESLKLLIAEYGELVVVLQDKGNGSYVIQFTDAKGNIIEKLCSHVTFCLPADNELCTIQAEFAGGTDNWGGQFDAVNLVLIFDAIYSGTYTVLDEQINIDDIDSLTEEEQKAIRFMVSKGFFELDGKSFNPDGSLNRYAFAKALVKMCFAVDNDAETSFDDVKKDNPYYPYVASGETKGIIKGYDDNNFHGDNDVLREEVIALCSRTLAERKGYVYPNNPADYMHFADNSDVIWGHSEISMAVREGLIEDGGILAPQTATSRRDAAIILYRLFMLLHEVEPVAVVTNAPMAGAGSASDGGSSIPVWPIAGAAAGVAAVGGGAAFVLLKRRKAAKLIKKVAETISESSVADVSLTTETTLNEDVSSPTDTEAKE